MYANKVGMMHESKGQHIGKAPSLHLFHTTVRQWMGVFLKGTTSCLGMKLKLCHVYLQHSCIDSGTLVICLSYNLDPELEWAADHMVIIISTCVKLRYLCTALITAWMGAN